MASTAIVYSGWVLAACLGATLVGCHDDATTNSATTVGASSVTGAVGTAQSVDTPPSIAGTPAASVAVGATYNFTPTAGHDAGLTVMFSINNKPEWAIFDPTTGALSGTPSAANVGTYTQIAITVTDGQDSASLPPFGITVSAPKQTGTVGIAGSPGATATVGSAYSFTPTTSETAGDKLSFAIVNKPVWATFDSSTGKLSGTPTGSSVGVTAQIVISVSDGTLSASLPAFSVSVAAVTDSVTLSWTTPTSNSNGTPAANLAGYRIYYGASASNLNTVIPVNGTDETQHVISNLKPGKWYFAVTSINTENIESVLSAVLPVNL